MALPACLSSEGARVGRAPQLIRLGGRGRFWDKRVRDFEGGVYPGDPQNSCLAVLVFSQSIVSLQGHTGNDKSTKSPWQHCRSWVTAGSTICNALAVQRFSLKHPNRGKAEKSTAH